MNWTLLPWRIGRGSNDQWNPYSDNLDTSVERFDTPTLWKIFITWVLTVATLI